MEKELSPQESLSIISSMIEKTRHTISDSSHYFLLWGYSVFIGCTIQFILLKINYPHHYYAWGITLPTLLIHLFLVSRDGKKEKVSTYIGDANGVVWIGIGICFFVMAFIFGRIGWQYCFPFYVMMYALGTFVSGNLIRFRPLIIGGIICFAMAAVIVYVEYELQILFTAISVLISYIIPGHMLRMKYKNQKA